MARESKKRDLSKLELKLDHSNHPLSACANGRFFLETFYPLYNCLIAIAQLAFSTVSVGLETETIINVLNKLSNTKLPREVIEFITLPLRIMGRSRLC